MGSWVADPPAAPRPFGGGAAGTVTAVICVGNVEVMGCPRGPAIGFRGNLHERNGGLLRKEQQDNGSLLGLSMARRSQQLFTGS